MARGQKSTYVIVEKLDPGTEATGNVASEDTVTVQERVVRIDDVHAVYQLRAVYCSRERVRN